MARVTIEDCIDKVKTRFDLVVAAAHRSREISSGDDPLVERDNDKNPVVALREIASGKVSTEQLLSGVVSSMQHQIESDEPEPEVLEAITDSRTTIGSVDEYTDEVAAASGMTIHDTSEQEKGDSPTFYQDVTNEEAETLQKG
jgi:DNA-directed RNA polymerase subunit omega